ncbi:unnamed protein product [Cochlearia groenlandica]
MVELRSRTQLLSQNHYIRSIKDGLIETVMNVVARGKSKLRFRKLVDVYNNKDDVLVVPTVVRDLDNGYEMKQGSCVFGSDASIEPNPEGEAMDFVSSDACKETETTTNAEFVEEINHDSPKERSLVLYCPGEPNSPGMVAVEEHVTTKKARCCLADDIDVECQTNVLYSIVPKEEVKLEVPQSSESETIGYVNNLTASNTSSEIREAKEDEQSNDSKPNLDMTATSLEIMKVEAPETLVNLDMAITGLEMVKVEAPKVLATDYSGLVPMDFGVENTEIMGEHEDVSANDELLKATDILLLSSSCDLREKLFLVPEDTTVSLEEDQMLERSQQQSSSTGDVDEARDHKSTQLFQAPNEVKTPEKTDSIQPQELHSPPEKLLSGRKALSPTSQANLLKAMEHPEYSPEKSIKKSKGKLYISSSSQNSHRIFKALDSIDRVEVIPTPKKATRKLNNNKRQRQYQGATQRLPRRDTRGTKSQPFSTGSTSLQGCAKKAIDFTQGQMHDFRYVAAKLSKELKSMREITKRCLLAESNTSKMSDYNINEVKALIVNSERSEESSKKWLSIIERDCNRFCKIMGLVKEDATDAIENFGHKKRKIRFADDEGGDLCHVKVFNLDLESESLI